MNPVNNILGNEDRCRLCNRVLDESEVDICDRCYKNYKRK